MNKLCMAWRQGEKPYVCLSSLGYGDPAIPGLTTPGLWCVPEEDHKTVGTQTSAGRAPGLSVTELELFISVFAVWLTWGYFDA